MNPETLVISQPFPGCYFDGFHARRPHRWGGRGLSLEVGPRAYNALLLEARKDGGLGVWPPTLDEWERAHG